MAFFIALADSIEKNQMIDKPNSGTSSRLLLSLKKSQFSDNEKAI